MSENSGGKYRTLPRGINLFSQFLLLLLALSALAWPLQPNLLFGIQIYDGQFVGYMSALFFCLIFLLVPPTRKAPRNRLPWYDLVFAILSLGFGGYYAVSYVQILLHPPGPNALNITFGCIAILLILESIRRFLGFSFVVIVCLTIVFAVFGYQMHLHDMRLPWQEWVYMFYTDESGIFGTVLKMLSSFVLCFFIFGTILTRMGGGEALINFSVAIMGRFTGGAGKVAIIASGIFGTVTGGSIIEASVIGPITIPLMKRSGFRPEFAAGVEASGATGGCIMPPVMGLAAFLIAQFLSMAYYEVVIAASIPAIFYFWILFLQTHIQAEAAGIKGLRRDELPPLKESTIKVLPFIIPMFVIFYGLLVLHLDLPKIAFYSVASALVASLFTKEGFSRLRSLPSILIEGGRSGLDVAAIGGGANLFVAGIMLSGITVTFSSVLLDISGGNVFALLVLAGIGSILLGFPLPSFVTYIIVAILLAPPLVQCGVVPIAVHMYLLYYGATAPITPPSCVAVFITRSIADADFWGSAWSAMRLSIGAYIIPWVFVFDEGLLLMGSANVIIYAILKAFIGATAIAIAFEGYWRIRLKTQQRVLLLLGGAGALAPHWLANLAGIAVLFFAVLSIKAIKHKKVLLKKAFDNCSSEKQT